MLRDANFITATAFGFFIGILLFSTLALLPPMMETLMGYPVVTTGLVTAPRGVGSLISMFLVGQLIRRADARLIILTGLIISAGALYGMTRFSLQMDARLFIWTGL